uniref:DUF3152 domain-containing protein n=2 Tax=Streptomyces lunaelactis TaxID=1535768 RepID=UPI00281643C0|nr:DUF3152 domain-containing protein [Streptomyces lunaelactis]
MGRHSRKGPAPKGSDSGNRSGTSGTPDSFGMSGTDMSSTGEWEAVGPASGGGARRRPGWPGQEQHTPSGYGTPQTRGGHPEQREAGGGWGAPQPQRYDTRPGGAQRVQAPAAPQRIAAVPRIPGPRREFVAAFEEPQPRRSPDDDPYGSVTAWDIEQDRLPETETETESRSGAGTDAREEKPAKGGRGRAFTGIAAAAVTTVLAVVVAGQVATDGPGKAGAQSAGGNREGAESPASRSDGRQVPPRNAPKPAAPLTYAQLMTTQFPLDPKLRGSGDFEAVPGFDRAPGKGSKIRYRVDVEKGLGLDGALFAKAVQATLNDDRSWAHGGAMTFERITSGEPEFVITLASPGTTATWCAKSGLDTSVDNVSCDSASTDRVMINAYRWAQGSETYGDKAMLTYRQMLINHEVGHRLGHGHVNCRTSGALAPVMQQQTKSLDVGGIKCRPNPWVHPGS